MSNHLMNTYMRQPVTFAKGKGIWLWDDKGEKYLDALAGVAVNGLGHAHPKLVKAISEQAAKLIHVSNIYNIAEQAALADKLCEISGMDKVFFCNSGCEANEAAIKLARLYGHNKGIKTPEIIVMDKSFHGRTMATLSATGNRKVQAGFEPLVSGFIRVPFDDIEAVKQVASRNSNVVAILVEPVQGEGGINIPKDAGAYLETLREICDANGWLLMLDEVQTGIGRTGTWFAFQHTSIKPDVMTLAKGLGSGVPIGACVASGKAAEVFTYGKHGSTFGGNPLATAAGLATLCIIEEEGLRENSEKIGNLIRAGFEAEFKDIKGVTVIRNAGLMIGIELDRPCGDLVKMALEAKLLINVTADKVVRLLPPLIMNEAEANELVRRLAALIKTFLNN
ncbi:aspartate aminotransferase family protein [Methylotenera sp.]|uniref:aspartate aminotransferase family protein n=2 Tax=Methylotenera sp. TaxID=2051956 RepID=UPI002717DFB2|nr:aspartate aminotransferase family protein [Methylotenera sp.]MDO9204518.1 aspartate aminotransferase family protein [Methylotenera sp.]MDP1523226.1 aspartate aminotransferase family protein [Methylotenera sp.]MDP2230396.1 aspartate aminotransferase family protein [Methylotenera sp.]MDP3306852.1 aspartate aminotransferase family protein [Methylotenera sp.]MDP3819246.1 aspartate aminotransferase family protein [Methylotenera sp.]